MCDNACIINFEAGLKVFMNSRKVYIDCLLKFLEDENFVHLEDALSKKKYEDAFEAAHTLKGLAANLRLELLYKDCSQLVEILRHNQYDDISYSFEILRNTYQKTIKYVQNYRI